MRDGDGDDCLSDNVAMCAASIEMAARVIAVVVMRKLDACDNNVDEVHIQAR